MKPFEILRMGPGSSSPIDGTSGSVDAGILAAVMFTVVGTTVSVVGQKNVSSVTRLALGVYRITFASALSNSNYGMMLSARRGDGSGDVPMLCAPNRDTTSGYNTYSTTTVDVVTQIPDGSNAATEANVVTAVVFDPSAVNSNYLAAASWTLSGTSITLQRQKNVASMTRYAVGVYRATFTSALADANYSEFGTSRYPTTAANIASPIWGNNRNTTIPTNLHSTQYLDLSTGLFNSNGTFKGNYEAGLGSVLISKSDVAPRGTIARARFSVSGGVCTLIAAYNIASVTYQATGCYRLNFNRPCVDANYGLVASGQWGAFNSDDVPIIGLNCNSSSSRSKYATDGCDIAVKNYANVAFDADYVNVWVLKPWLM